MIAQWQDVSELTKLRPECGVAALLDDGPIALFRISDTEVHAVDHVDPRTHTPTIARGLVGSANGEPIVISPLLKDRFSLKDGRCLNADLPPLRTFEVRVEEDRVQVRPNVTAQKQS